MKPSDIIKLAATLFDISIDRLCSAERTREVAAARSAAIFAIRHRYPELSMETIAAQLHLRDRKSAYNAINRCSEYMSESSAFRQKVQILMHQNPAQRDELPLDEQLSRPIDRVDRWAVFNLHQRGTARVLSA